MKKSIFCFLALTFLLVSFFPDTVSADFKKTKIAVLDFQLQGSGYETADMGKIVAEWLITALVKEGRFDVVERRLMEKLLDELKYGSSGLADESTVAKIGKHLGAKVVITGSIMRFQNVMEVNARIIEVESSSIIAAENVKSTSAIRLEDLVVQMAEKIIKDFPLEGYVVERTENSILIDLGKRAGVKIGMQFIAYKEGRVIKHPKTGEVLDVEKIETGTIEIKDVQTKTSTATIVKEASPNAIKNSQMVKSTVELVPEPLKKITAEPLSTPIVIQETDLLTRLQSIDQQSEELKQLREGGNPAWKLKFKNILISLKTILVRHKTSPEIYLSYAKAYFAAGDIGDAEKLLRKAFHFRPQYTEAFIFKGDMYYEYTKKLDPERRIGSGYDITSRDAYLAALNSSQDKDLQAMMYLKIGDVYAELARDKENAKTNWQKAASTAPNSSAARLADERLRAN